MSTRDSGPTRVLAPCKINPTLTVIERRADGFHELDLTFLALALADRLELESSAERAGTLTVEGPMASDDIPQDESNLARRATRGVLAIARLDGLAAAKDDFDLRLSKEIPSRAGLGGGSSDAAAAALGVCARTGLSAADPRVLAGLTELGSDPAFFLAARDTGHARGRGRGERIEVLPPLSTRLWIALLAPRRGARTESVYRGLGVLGTATSNRALSEDRTAAWSRATSIEELRGALCNDLQPAAIRAYPELARWRSCLDRQALAHFILAGSGSTFFGLYLDEKEAGVELATARQAASLEGLDLRGSWLTSSVAHGVRVIH